MYECIVEFALYSATGWLPCEIDSRGGGAALIAAFARYPRLRAKRGCPSPFRVEFPPSAQHCASRGLPRRSPLRSSRTLSGTLLSHAHSTELLRKWSQRPDWRLRHRRAAHQAQRTSALHSCPPRRHRATPVERAPNRRPASTRPSTRTLRPRAGSRPGRAVPRASKGGTARRTGQRRVRFILPCCWSGLDCRTSRCTRYTTVYVNRGGSRDPRSTEPVKNSAECT